MKRLLKRILLLSILAAAGLVAFRLIGRRRALPAEPHGWSPQASPPQAVHVEVHPPEPAVAEEDAVVPESPPVALADAVEPPLASPAENEAPTAAVPEVSEPPQPEPPAEPALEPPGPAAGDAIEDAGADVESGRLQSKGEAGPPEEEDFLTGYFNKLAATPDEQLVEQLAGMAEPGLQLAPPHPEPAWIPADEAVERPLDRGDPASTPGAPPPPGTQDSPELPASLEAALTELAPIPIVPPPRRTAESYLDEGNVYFNVGQYQLAIERYSTAVEMDGELVAAYYNRANARTRSGEFEAALSDYDRALELQPFDADALNNRGMLHLYRANYPAALRDFNAALVIDPSDTTVIVNRGLAHLHSGDAADALKDFREAVAVDGEDAAAHYGASQAAAVLGNNQEALRSVARALELNPGYAGEAAGDPNLASLQGDPQFLKLLRESGGR